MQNTTHSSTRSEAESITSLVVNLIKSRSAVPAAQIVLSHIQIVPSRIQLSKLYNTSHRFSYVLFPCRLETISANISIPIHLRYHQAALGKTFVAVSLLFPSVLGRCNGM